MGNPDTPKTSLEQSTLPDAALDKATGGATAGFSDMGSMQQMQLQMAMEKKSQLESMISNVMKSTSDTGNTIASNLKSS